MNIRHCNRCNKDKPIEDFPIDKSKALGHSYWCKECWTIRDRERAKTPNRIAQVAKWHQSERGKMMDKQRRLFRKEKIRAKNILNYFIEKGIIKRYSCEKCGDGNSQGHHPDYSKPLEVVWLCQAHHTEEHKQLKVTHPP